MRPILLYRLEGGLNPYPRQKPKRELLLRQKINIKSGKKWAAVV